MSTLTYMAPVKTPHTWEGRDVILSQKKEIKNLNKQKKNKNISHDCEGELKNDM